MPDKKIYLPDAETRLYGIVGDPVEHSLSPAMHNAAFRALGINAVYLAFCVTSAESAVRAIRDLNIQGVSVTIPHKESMIQFLDQADEFVSAIGAVNTIKNRDGRLCGTNTDWIGAVKALQEKAAIEGKRAVVLGAGGSARAVVYGLRRHGAEVHVANRTVEKAERLASEFGCTFSGLDRLHEITGDILVNTTSVGMAGPSGAGKGQMPIAPETAGQFSVVMDIVYSPLKTRLLEEAEARGAEVIDGLRMLLHQALAQFEFWTGKSAPKQVMEEALYSAYKARDRSKKS